MNKENITRYFNDLKEVYDKYGLDKYPSRVLVVSISSVSSSADSCDGLPHKLSISIFPEILSNKVDFGTEKLMEAFLTDIPFFTAKGRHTDLSLRSPEATAVNRHSAMNKENITRYFSDLKEVYDKYGLDKYPSRVWNMDETGISFSPKPLKVLAKKLSSSLNH
jgi:DNA-directed RNA polymerase subunit N (RpoN/RPB10)